MNRSSDWRWLDRHSLGLGLVRVIRADGDSLRIVRVYDPEQQDEYPAALLSLRVFHPKSHEMAVSP